MKRLFSSLIALILLACSLPFGAVEEIPPATPPPTIKALAATPALEQGNTAGGANGTQEKQPLRVLAEKRGILIGSYDDGLDHDIYPLQTDPTYAQVFAREFNAITVAVGFATLQPKKGVYDNLDYVDSVVDFAQANGMKVFGQHLVWFEMDPDWLTDETCTRENFMNILENHIKTVVGRYKGRIYAWSVVNEELEYESSSFRNTLWGQCIGDDFIDLAFQWAHEADPEAKLYYNETDAEAMGSDFVGQRADKVYELVQGLVNRGVPIDGVGLQMHTDLGGDVFPEPREPQSVAQNMARLAALGLEVYITEMDVAIYSETGNREEKLIRQADTYRDMLDVCLHQSMCKAFIMWGFTDKYSWIYDISGTSYPDEAPLIFDAEYNPKPAYNTLVNVLYEYVELETEAPAGTPSIPAPAEVNQAASSPEFIRRQGDQLVVGADAHEIRLRGINFNNYHWEEEAALIINSDHHSETDFQRVADMGMNVIRFNLSYVIFEDGDAPYEYKQAGWDWLDQNVEWARKYGVYLLVDMHMPQGAYQGGTMGDAGEGTGGFWETENQNRLRALWRAIAERYRNEPVIAAWDVVNEPTPQDQAQWETLAQALVDEIRAVDQNHLIIVEQALFADGSAGPLFLVNDDNVMYDFHFYSPDNYTHQYTYFSGQGDGGNYPDPETPVLPREFVYGGYVENPRVPPGDSDWTFYEGVLHPITDPQTVSATPVFACDANQGTVYFDDFIVNEYDEERNLVRQTLAVNVEELDWDDESNFGIEPYIVDPVWWEAWSDDGSGFDEIAAIGHMGEQSLSISEVGSSYNLSNGGLTFAVKRGYHYQISGWMKGEGVTDESCLLTLEFAQIPPGEEFTPFDRDYLESVLLDYLEFGATHNVPINVGEFGLSKWSFAADKGGLTWVRDMLELFDQYSVNFQYWDYHSDDFGLYQNRVGLPDLASTNQGLIDLFTELLR